MVTITSMAESKIKELIQEAAELTGQSLTDFAVSTLTETARRIVQQNSMTVLSNRDRDVFLTQAEFAGEAGVALRLFDGTQVGPLQIFNER